MLPTTERMTSTPEPVEPSRMLVVLHTYQDILHLPGLQSCIQFSGRWLFGRSAVRAPLGIGQGKDGDAEDEDSFFHTTYIDADTNACLLETLIEANS